MLSTEGGGTIFMKELGTNDGYKSGVVKRVFIVQFVCLPLVSINNL